MLYRHKLLLELKPIWNRNGAFYVIVWPPSNCWVNILDQLSQKTLVSSIFGLIFKIFNKVWDVTHFLIWNFLAKVRFFFFLYISMKQFNSIYLSVKEVYLNVTFYNTKTHCMIAEGHNIQFSAFKWSVLIITSDWIYRNIRNITNIKLLY